MAHACDFESAPRKAALRSASAGRGTRPISAVLCLARANARHEGRERFASPRFLTPPRRAAAGLRAVVAASPTEFQPLGQALPRFTGGPQASVDRDAVFKCRSGRSRCCKSRRPWGVLGVSRAGLGKGRRDRHALELTGAGRFLAWRERIYSQRGSRGDARSCDTPAGPGALQQRDVTARAARPATSASIPTPRARRPTKVGCVDRTAGRQREDRAAKNRDATRAATSSRVSNEHVAVRRSSVTRSWRCRNPTLERSFANMVRASTPQT